MRRVHLDVVHQQLKVVETKLDDHDTNEYNTPRVRSYRFLGSPTICGSRMFAWDNTFVEKCDKELPMSTFVEFPFIWGSSYTCEDDKDEYDGISPVNLCYNGKLYIVHDGRVREGYFHDMALNSDLTIDEFVFLQKLTGLPPSMVSLDAACDILRCRTLWKAGGYLPQHVNTYEKITTECVIQGPEEPVVTRDVIYEYDFDSFYPSIMMQFRGRSFGHDVYCDTMEPLLRQKRAGSAAEKSVLKKIMVRIYGRLNYQGDMFPNNPAFLKDIVDTGGAIMRRTIKALKKPPLSVLTDGFHCCEDIGEWTEGFIVFRKKRKYDRGGVFLHAGQFTLVDSDGTRIERGKLMNRTRQLPYAVHLLVRRIVDILLEHGDLKRWTISKLINTMDCDVENGAYDIGADMKWTDKKERMFDPMARYAVFMKEIRQAFKFFFLN